MNQSTITQTTTITSTERQVVIKATTAYLTEMTEMNAVLEHTGGGCEALGLYPNEPAATPWYIWLTDDASVWSSVEDLLRCESIVIGVYRDGGDWSGEADAMFYADNWTQVVDHIRRVQNCLLPNGSLDMGKLEALVANDT